MLDVVRGAMHGGGATAASSPTLQPPLFPSAASVVATLGKLTDGEPGEEAA